MKHKKPIFLFSISMFLGCNLFAKPRVELLAQELEKTKTNLVADEVKQRKIQSALFAINHKMKKVVGEKANLEQEKLLVEGNVKELATKITQLEMQTKEQRARLRSRLATIYKLGGQGAARLLLASKSSAEFERNLKILGIVAKNDIALIHDYKNSQKELVKRKQKLNLRWAHLKKVQEKIAQKERVLSGENELKRKILQSVKNSQAYSRSKLAELRKKSQKFAAQDESGFYDLLLRPSFFEKKGHLPAPVQGQLVQGFGLIKDDFHKVVFSHKGHFYAAPYGSPVKAVFEGKVAFAGSVPGFGQTLILDHGDHYYSVYSHNKALQVKEGDEVKQSQVIALTGQASPDIGEGLYFEIRHFSEPSDPKLWMKGSTL